MISKVYLTKSEVNERRLKTIYNLLEENNFKKAINEADKVLKKDSNFYSIKVLKGLAMYRLGKQLEAFLLIEEIIKSIPTDESTLNSLTYFYKEINQKNKIVEYYEKALTKYPDREDICVNLFHYHTKNIDFVSQEKVAKQLTKMNTNDSQYRMWSIICNVLNGLYNDDERLVKIGEAFLARFMKTMTSNVTVEIVEFFLFTLEKLNKFEESLDWLNGKVLKEILEKDQNKELFSRYKISLLLKVDRKLETCDLYWSQLLNNVNDVCQWRDYIDVVVGLNLDGEKCEHSISSVLRKLNSLDSRTIGIKIAKIHLNLKLQSAGLQSQLSLSFGTFTENMVEYFIGFGHKPCCLFDIFSFMALESVSFDNRREIISEMDRLTDTLCVSKVKNVEDIERHFLVAVLKRDLGIETNISQLMTMYDHCEQFCRNISHNELRPCDNFLTLAVFCYYDQWYENRQSNWRPIIDSLALLQKSLDRSPANYHLRLQLSHLFGLLHCSDLLIGQFDELEVKQIMWDTMGYVFILPIVFVPCFQQRWRFFQRNIDRKRKNKTDIEDGLVNCFKLERYSKIPELIEFRQSVNESVMSFFCEVENAYFATVLKTNSYDELIQCFNDEIPLRLLDVFQAENYDFDIFSHMVKVLKDFRDLNTFFCFNRFDRMWSEMDRKLSFDNIVFWLSQRFLVIRLLHQMTFLTMESITILEKIISGSITPLVSTQPTSDLSPVQSTVKQLTDVWVKLNSLSDSYENLSFNLFGCVRLPTKFFSFRYLETLKACSESVNKFYDVFVRNLHDIEFSDWIVLIGGPIKSILVDEILPEEEGLESVDNFMQLIPIIISRLTVICELFSFITLFLSMILEITKPIERQFSSKIQSRKKRSEPLDKQSALFPEWIGQKYKLFIISTNIRQSPSYFIDLSLTVKKFISRIKSRISQLQYCNLVLLSILSSWKMSLDEASNFISLKKDQLQQIGKVFQDDVS